MYLKRCHSPVGTTLPSRTISQIIIIILPFFCGVTLRLGPFCVGIRELEGKKTECITNLDTNILIVLEESSYRTAWQCSGIALNSQLERGGYLGALTPRAGAVHLS